MRRVKTGMRTQTWKVAALAAALIACVPQIPNSLYISNHSNNHLTTTELSGSIAMLIPLPDRFSFAVMASHWRNRSLPLHEPIIVRTRKEAAKIQEKRSANNAGLSATEVHAATKPPHQIQAVESASKIIAMNTPVKSIKARRASSRKRLKRWKPTKKIKKAPVIKTAGNWADRALFPDAAF